LSPVFVVAVGTKGLPKTKVPLTVTLVVKVTGLVKEVFVNTRLAAVKFPSTETLVEKVAVLLTASVPPTTALLDTVIPVLRKVATSENALLAPTARVI
jgi:hypothetical protein